MLVKPLCCHATKQKFCNRLFSTADILTCDSEKKKDRTHKYKPSHSLIVVQIRNDGDF